MVHVSSGQSPRHDASNSSWPRLLACGVVTTNWPPPAAIDGIRATLTLDVQVLHNVIERDRVELLVWQRARAWSGPTVDRQAGGSRLSSSLRSTSWPATCPPRVRSRTSLRPGRRAYRTSRKPSEITRAWHRVQPEQPAARLIAFAHTPFAADAEKLVDQGVVQQLSRDAAQRAAGPVFRPNGRARALRRDCRVIARPLCDGAQRRHPNGGPSVTTH